MNIDNKAEKEMSYTGDQESLRSEILEAPSSLDMSSDNVDKPDLRSASSNSTQILRTVETLGNKISESL